MTFFKSDYPFVLIILSLVISLGVFFRNDLFGFDAYASWECVKGACDFLGLQPLAIYLFQFFPDSLLFFKFVMFGSVLISLVALFFVGKRFFCDRVSWVSLVLLSGLSPLIVFLFGQFENELFAFPLLFWGFYFVLSKSFWVRFLCLPLFGLACLFWGGSLFFVLVNIPLFFVLVIPIGWVVFFMGGLFWGALTPNALVLESRLFAGFSNLFFLVFVVPFVFRCKNICFWLSFVLAVVLVGVNGKFVVFLLPFLLVGIGYLVLFVEKKGFNSFYVVLVCVFLLFGWNISFFMQQPTANDWFLVKETIKIQKDTNYLIQNDWSFGYWLIHEGYDTNYYGGGKYASNPKYEKIEKPFIALTQQDLNCRKINRYSNYFRNANLFVCD